MIDVLVPMLGRPEAIQPLVESFEQHSGLDDRLIFLLSPNDPIEKVCRDIGAEHHIMGWEPGPGDYAYKMNVGYTLTSQPWLFLGASDITFTPGWTKPAGMDFDVIATNDQANAQVQRGMFGTHCFVRREYIEARGGTGDGIAHMVLHEAYDHNFVDRELCGVAQHRGRFHYASDSIVPHRHHLWGTAPKDRTYIKGMRHYRQDHRLFLSRAHLWGYAGLTPSERRLASRQHRGIVRRR